MQTGLYSGGKQAILFGTDNGVYMHSPLSRSSMVPLLFISSVAQIDVLEHHDLVVILSGHSSAS